ncbi:cytochrome P450 [Flindersiella endophytica]
MFPIGAAATLAELEADPHPLHARLRASEPVSWLPALNGWLVTRHDLAQSVLRAASDFTVDDPRFSTAAVVGPSMLSLDGAAHGRHRAAFAPEFKPRQVRERYGDFVTAETRRLVDGFRADGQAELRRGLAGPLAVAVVTEALGLGRTNASAVLGWYDAIVSAVTDISSGRPASPAGARAFDELRSSIAASLAAAHGDSGLSVDELVSNAAVLMFGGIETTEGEIVNLALHLLSAPDQLALVRADPALLDNALEESVRLEPAAAVVDRYATRDISLGGASIAAGDLVTVSLAGANRDPAVFTDPDRFDVRRANARQHLAFAHGPHFCVGADLARLEVRTALQALLDLPGLRLDEDQPRPAARGLVFRKPPALHVRWS